MNSLSLSRKLLCLNIALLLCISVVSPAALAAETDAEEVLRDETSLIINGVEYSASEECGSYELGWHYYASPAGDSVQTYPAQLDIYNNYSGLPIYVPCSVEINLFKSMTGYGKLSPITVDGDTLICVYNWEGRTDNPVVLIGGEESPAITASGEVRIDVFREPMRLTVKSGKAGLAAIQATSVRDIRGYFYAGTEENNLSIVSEYNGEECTVFADMSHYIRTQKDIKLTGECTVPEAPEESGSAFVAWREVTEDDHSFDESRWYMPGDKVDAGEGIKLRPEYISSNGASAAIIIDGNGGETTYGSRYYVHYVSASELHPYPVVQHTSSADLQQYYRLPGNPFVYQNQTFLSYNTSPLGDGTKYRSGDFLPEGNLIYRLYVQWMYRELDSVIARSEVELCGTTAPNGNRDSQTNNGNLITEAMRWKALNVGKISVDDANVVAVTNGGGIRSSIEVGNVRRRDIYTVLPFGNTVAVVYVTGAELLEALEASTYCTPSKLPGYPQTTGIKWTLNTVKPYDAREETYPDSSYYGPASIQRVTIESINGKPFNAEETYAVVTNDFCAAGGDTYYAFYRACEDGAGFDTGVLLADAVCEYIETELKGVISKKYAADRGDLTMITADTVTASGTMGNYGEISWSYRGYKRQLTITGDEIGTDKPLYIAEYADSGKMLGVTIAKDKDATINTNDKAKVIKLMWLDKDGVPLCRPELIQSL